MGFPSILGGFSMPHGCKLRCRARLRGLHLALPGDSREVQWLGRGWLWAAAGGACCAGPLLVGAQQLRDAGDDRGVVLPQAAPGDVVPSGVGVSGGAGVQGLGLEGRRLAPERGAAQGPAGHGVCALRGALRRPLPQPALRPRNQGAFVFWVALGPRCRRSWSWPRWSSCCRCSCCPSAVAAVATSPRRPPCRAWGPSSGGGGCCAAPTCIGLGGSRWPGAWSPAPGIPATLRRSARLPAAAWLTTFGPSRCPAHRTEAR